MRCPADGGINSVMRAKAVAPTRTAPTMANASPAFGRHADLGQSMRRMIARDARRHGIEKTDQDADQWRADGGERDLSDRERGAAGEHADNECADHARAAVKRGEARGKAGKERKRVNGKRKQQPAEEAEADDTENKADDNHGGYSVTKVERMRPSTTTTAHPKHSPR